MQAFRRSLEIFFSTCASKNNIVKERWKENSGRSGRKEMEEREEVRVRKEGQMSSAGN